ncbi:hypothetical protein AB0D86_32420 [Streptomyces sp. NPDC048324]|uniref:hypothetical protein n=1 Tax=Streptomyces sp. NPDC048324 TaxID=3157205 RepID=UPI003421F455
MPRNNSQAPHTVRREHARRRARSKWSLAVVGGPMILAVVAGSVFAAGGHHRHQPGGGAGAQSTQAAEPDPNCTLVVPEHPLTARGLATPYRLVATDPRQGPCHEADPGQAAFVEAAILTRDGKLTVYDPLVIDRGTRPAARTVRPRVPKGSTVGIWFGFNAAQLTLKSSGGSRGLAQGRCVNGAPGSVFGQFAYCNAPAFFRAADVQKAQKHLRIPALGTAKDGLPCPTTRDFSVVDQDGSDNVVTHYLADAHGRTAQSNAASRAVLRRTGAKPADLTNGSDNLLLTHFIDPALGCTPFTAPDQSSDGRASSALPLDELSAAARQRAPIALIPQNDPMTLVDGHASVRKTDLYRAGVDMPPVGAGDDGNGAAYCRKLFAGRSGIHRVFEDRSLLRTAPSPDPATAPNLFGFLASRANQSFTNLGCDRLLGSGNPVVLTTDGQGLVTDAVLRPLGRVPASPTPTGTARSTSPSATPATSSPAVNDGPSSSPTGGPGSAPSASGEVSTSPSAGAPDPSVSSVPPPSPSTPPVVG